MNFNVIKIFLDYKALQGPVLWFLYQVQLWNRSSFLSRYETLRWFQTLENELVYSNLQIVYIIHGVFPHINIKWVGMLGVRMG